MQRGDKNGARQEIGKCGAGWDNLYLPMRSYPGTCGAQSLNSRQLERFPARVCWRETPMRWRDPPFAGAAAWSPTAGNVRLGTL